MSAGEITQASNYTRRKWFDIFMRGMTVFATVLALIPLFLIIGYVLYRGVSGLSIEFFTEAYKPPTLTLGGDTGEATAGGGVLHGIVGTFMIVGAAMLIALPVGILAGVFLSEYPSTSLSTAVRFATDVLSAAPSIIVGVVAYTLIVWQTKEFSGLAGSVALAVLMVPVVTRTTEEILKLVPNTVREAAMGLGAPKWWLTLTVVIPAALGGIVTGAMLSFARGAGETAPLLLTVLGNNNVTFNLLEPMAALPLVTYRYTEAPYAEQNELAWTSALVLTTLVLLVNILARWATRSKVK
jgi:phosphate transport system permease protein